MLLCWVAWNVNWVVNDGGGVMKKLILIIAMLFMLSSCALLYVPIEDRQMTRQEKEKVAEEVVSDILFFMLVL